LTDNISEKDKKDWENFLSKNEKLPNKDIKLDKKIDKILNVTVDFIAEVITCIKDKDKKVISGDPEKIKKIYDTWVFSRDITSANPNWQLVNTLT
jgi:predicted lipid-binding transport protein (Tim44 family)